MTDLTHQPARDGQRTDAYKDCLAKYNFPILVYISTDDEVCIHILRRNSPIMDRVMLIDFLQPPCFPETHLLPKLIILHSFTP
jgi:hypothetical protein